LVVGLAVIVVPFEVPQTPLITHHVSTFFAVQFVVVPQLVPAQVQVHGHVQFTTLDTHELHKLYVGFVDIVVSFTLQHTQSKLKFTPSNLQPTLDELYQAFLDHQLNCKLQYDKQEFCV
jgi:hypothetical protein